MLNSKLCLFIKRLVFIFSLFFSSGYTSYAFAVMPLILQTTPGISLKAAPNCIGSQPPDIPFNFNFMYLSFGRNVINYYSPTTPESIYRFVYNDNEYEIDVNTIVDHAFDIWGRALDVTFVRVENADASNIIVNLNAPLYSRAAGVGVPRLAISTIFTPNVDYNRGRIFIAPVANFNRPIAIGYPLALADSTFNGDVRSFILARMTYTVMHEIGHVLGLNHVHYFNDDIPQNAVPITSPTEVYPVEPTLMNGFMELTDMPGFMLYLQQFMDYNNRPVSGPDDIKPSQDEINALRNLLRPFGNKSFALRDASSNSDTCPNPYQGVSEAIVTSGIFKDNPSWIDVDGDGAQDFCTVDGSNLKCYINNNGNFTEKVLDYNPGFDLGWADTRSFIKGGINENKERLTAFCRGYGSNSFRCDYFRFDKKREELVYSFQKTIDYTDLGWTDGRVGLDDGSRQSDRRWYVDLEGLGIQSYCRLVGRGDTSLACWLNKGKDGYARDIWSTGMGQLNNSDNVFGWIKYKNSVALCWTYFNIGVKVAVKCMPYNKLKSKFDDPVEFNMVTDYVKSGTGRFIYKYIDNGYEPQSGAYCFVNRNGKWNCKVLDNEDIPVVEYGSLPNNDEGWGDSIGFTTFPGSSFPGACSLVGTWTLQCQTLVYEYDESMNTMFSRSDSMQGFGIDGGYASIYDGNRRWMQFGDKNSLFCRKTGGDNMTCNHLYYGVTPK